MFRKGIRKARELKVSHFTSMLNVIMEQACFKTVLRHRENNEVICDSRHGSTKGKSCLTNLVAFCDRVTAVADKGRVTDKASLDRALSDLV